MVQRNLVNSTELSASKADLPSMNAGQCLPCQATTAIMEMRSFHTIAIMYSNLGYPSCGLAVLQERPAEECLPSPAELVLWWYDCLVPTASQWTYFAYMS